MLRSGSTAPSDGDSEQTQVPPAVGRVNGPRVRAGTMSKDEDEPALRPRRKVSGRRPRLRRACAFLHLASHASRTRTTNIDRSINRVIKSHLIIHFCWSS